MRHYLLSGAVAELSGSVFVATGQTRLIALPGCLDGLSAGQLRAVAGTVALAAVAVAANQYRCATAGAEIVSS